MHAANHASVASICAPVRGVSCRVPTNVRRLAPVSCDSHAVAVDSAIPRRVWGIVRNIITCKRFKKRLGDRSLKLSDVELARLFRPKEMVDNDGTKST